MTEAITTNKGASRIAAAFDNRKAFIPFVTCGDPTLETTKQLVRAMEASGADIVELGIPFSDPTAEGPVIQEANIRALNGGVDTDQIFAMVEELRSGSDGGVPVQVPLAFMTYGNVVYHYGTREFARRAAQVGVDALILPDVSFEEKAEFALPCGEEGVALISLIAPTSEARIAEISSEAEGFIYLVSSLGVTGMRSSITTDLESIVAHIREVTQVPVAIGFGISSPEQAAAMAQKADGAIVGSALVKLIAEAGEEAVAPVAEAVRAMAAAVHEV
jgi:tryptophan synthase alpha chain